ncbi:MAG: hypothetical protein DRJ57_02375, partial [Thermoprotei archaeon]
DREVVSQGVEKGVRVTSYQDHAYPLLHALAYYLPVTKLIVAENGGVVGYRSRYRLLGSEGDGEEIRRLVREELAGVLVESWQNRFRLVDMAFHPAEGLSPEEAVERARRALEPRGFEVQYSGWAIHVHRRGVDKGAGLVEACKMLGLDPRQAIAVGDSEVDRPMLEAAGLAVAVGNAPRGLRRVADIITREGYYRGFLEAIKLLEEGGYI